MAKNDNQKDKNHPLKQESGITRSVVGRKQFVRKAFLDSALSGNPTAEQLAKHKAELKEKRANEKANEKWRELVALQARQFRITDAFVHRNPLFRHELPLYTTVKEESHGVFKAYVTPGSIVDILTTTGNNFTVIGIDPNTEDIQYGLWRYPITPGAWVYIDFVTLKTGAPQSPKLVVANSVPESLQFQPPVGVDPGADGHMYVKVAQFVIEDGAIKVYHHAGGNDYIHDRNRPPFNVLPGAATDIFEKYDLYDGIYKYLGIKGIFPIEVNRVKPNIEISFAGAAGADLDLKIVKWSFETEPDGQENVPITITLPSGFETNNGVNDGDHNHEIATHYHSAPSGNTGLPEVDYGVWLSRTGQYNTDFSDDGAHKHAISGTINATAKIPVRGRHYIKISDEPADILCIRAGLFVGAYAEGDILPDQTGNGVLFFERTYYSYEGPPEPPLAPTP